MSASSGITGVVRASRSGSERFYARVQRHGRSFSAGSFGTVEEAAEAVQRLREIAAGAEPPPKPGRAFTVVICHRLTGPTTFTPFATIAEAVEAGSVPCGREGCLAAHTVVHGDGRGGFRTITVGAPPSEVRRKILAADDARRERLRQRSDEKRKRKRGPAPQPRCRRGHERTKANTVIRKSGKRECRLCAEATQRAAYARKRAAARAAVSNAAETAAAGACGGNPAPQNRSQRPAIHVHWKSKGQCRVRSKTRRRRFRRRRKDNS